ncbi:hypothetical protein EIN_418870, partial [Entamoeba invadens IP1]
AAQIQCQRSTHMSKEAGAYIVLQERATPKSSQQLCDNMAIAASKALADFAEKRGITPDNIIGTMDEPGIFPREAADVAMQAIKDGVARITNLTWQQVYDMAEKDIKEAREGADLLIEKKFIKEFPQDLLDESINTAINVATK